MNANDGNDHGEDYAENAFEYRSISIGEEKEIEGKRLNGRTTDRIRLTTKGDRKEQSNFA